MVLWQPQNRLRKENRFERGPQDLEKKRVHTNNSSPGKPFQTRQKSCGNKELQDNDCIDQNEEDAIEHDGYAVTGAPQNSFRRRGRELLGLDLMRPEKKPKGPTPQCCNEQAHCHE